jgi:hypothetical protein
MDTVLGRSTLKKALLDEGIKDIRYLSTLKDTVIDGLQYEDTTFIGTLISCKKHDKIMIKCFLAYEEHLGQEGLNGDYNAITQESFDQF